MELCDQDVDGWTSDMGCHGPEMLARSVEGAIEKEGEIFGDQAQFFVFLVWGRSGENLQGDRQQPIKGPRMNGEARGKPIADSVAITAKTARWTCPLPSRKGWIFPNQQNV